jgi:F-type H+-transporting ATPase subunit delta
MVNVSVARRYAKALLEVAAEAASLDRVTEQLNGFVKMMQQSSELSDILTNPAYTRSQQGAVMESVIKSLGSLAPAVANLLRLLVERHRMSYLADIARLFGDMADARSGRVRGKVISAVKLPDETIRRLEQSLTKLTQRNVVLDSKVDASLLGGVSAQVGSLMYDGSLKSQLEDLRRTLNAR